MNEELEMREGTEEAMIAKDEMAAFEPFEMPAEGDVPDMSDDDIAAALGYHTTLSEPLLPQDEMSTAEGEAVETADESPETAEDAELEEKPKESSEKLEEPDDTTEEVDDEQSKEIEEIRKELEKLQEEVYGEKTEDTEPTG